MFGGEEDVFIKRIADTVDCFMLKIELSSTYATNISAQCASERYLLDTAKVVMIHQIPPLKKFYFTHTGLHLPCTITPRSLITAPPHYST